MASRDSRFMLSFGAALAEVLSGAAVTGFLVNDAAAVALRPPLRRDEEKERQGPPLLLHPPLGDGGTVLAAHRSHRSHSSHVSGRGSRSSYHGYSSDDASDSAPAVVTPRPKPVKPAVVFFVAVPGGRISIDGTDAGQDKTRMLKLPPGKHTVRVTNSLIGETEVEIELTEGQSGEIVVRW